MPIEDPLAKKFAKFAGKAKQGVLQKKPGELKKRHSASTLSLPSVSEGATGCQFAVSLNLA